MRRTAAKLAALGFLAIAGYPAVFEAGAARHSEKGKLDMVSFSLTYLDRYDIKNKSEGLKEPSGLALAKDRNGLWTVSDDTKKVFKLDLEGNLDTSDSFEIAVKGLEGITLDGSGDYLVAAREDDNEIVRIEIAERAVTETQPLADMAGWAAVAGYFTDDIEGNKGLEGITWNRHRGTFFTLKEGDPGLLLEISSDLETILNHRELKPANGFQDPGLNVTKIDFSGISYDPTRSAFWIVSDKAKRLYLYDWDSNRVVQSSTLGFVKDGKYREVEKAEGVAIDPEANRLYVVSDEEVRLYVFDLRN